MSRLDLLTVEGNSVDARGWNWARSIMPPDQRLPAGDLDFGEGRNTAHLGPGWSRGTQESLADKEEISFVRGLSERAVIFVSLPPGAVELVAHLSAPEDGGLESIEVAIDGRNIARWHPCSSRWWGGGMAIERAAALAGLMDAE